MLSSMMVTASPMPKRRARVKGEVPEIMRVESIDEMSERLVETATAARIRLTPDSGSLVIVLVGLPARGKSMLGHKLARFLTWRGYKTKHFCAGDKRRHAWNRDGDRKQLASASMFDSQKAYASMTRETISMDTFEELVTWLRADSGQVAIFDACNSTMARRKKLTERIHLLNASVKAGSGGQGAGIVFIESVVTDPEVVHTMSLWKVRNSADFAGMTEEAALADLNERIGHYERGYQTVHETEGPYIKLFDLRAKVHACNVYGRMAKSVLPYLLALHSIARPIFMLVIDDDYSYVLPGGGGESKAQLTAGLARWVKSYPRRDELCILTSAAPRAKETAEALADAAGCARPSPRGPLTPLLHAAEAIARSSSERRNSAGATAPDGQPSRAGGAPLPLRRDGRPRRPSSRDLARRSPTLWAGSTRWSPRWRRRSLPFCWWHTRRTAARCARCWSKPASLFSMIARRSTQRPRWSPAGTTRRACWSSCPRPPATRRPSTCSRDTAWDRTRRSRWGWAACEPVGLGSL